MLSASVTVDAQLISSIGKGILVFAAVAPGDTEKDAEALAAKIIKMRLWDDEAGGRVGDIYPVDECSRMVLISSSGSTTSKTLVARFSVVRFESFLCTFIWELTPG